MPRLSGSQLKQLHDALISAFPRQSQLAQMVKFGEVHGNLYAIAGGDNLSDVVFSLLEWAEARDQIGKLMVAARKANADNPALRKVAEELLLESPLLPQAELERVGGLEKIVLESVDFADVESWLQRLGDCTLAVCRVEISAGKGVGTGFLVGPDLLLTNHHVVEQVLDGRKLSKPLLLRFDFKAKADGSGLFEGTEHQALEVVDSNKALDYALLRLKGKPGEELVGIRELKKPRGWLQPLAHTCEPGEPLFILQHPEAWPMQVAAGSVLGTEGSRVIYSTNTVRGSSGSPCFNHNWEVVALHHWGDEDKSGNRGVMFSSILKQPRLKAALNP